MVESRNLVLTFCHWTQSSPLLQFSPFLRKTPSTPLFRWLAVIILVILCCLHYKETFSFSGVIKLFSCHVNVISIDLMVVGVFFIVLDRQLIRNSPGSAGLKDSHLVVIVEGFLFPEFVSLFSLLDSKSCCPLLIELLRVIFILLEADDSLRLGSCQRWETLGAVVSVPGPRHPHRLLLVVRVRHIIQLVH